jgi:hypothetical protein
MSPADAPIAEMKRASALAAPITLQLRLISVFEDGEVGRTAMAVEARVHLTFPPDHHSAAATLDGGGIIEHLLQLLFSERTDFTFPVRAPDREIVTARDEKALRAIRPAE